MSPGLAALYLALALLALAGWLGLRARRAARRTRCALYHIPGPGGRALRIGITVDPGARESKYRCTAWWWYQRTGPLTVRRWYPDEATAHCAEIPAIRRERPPHNFQHNPDRGKRYAKLVPARSASSHPAGRPLRSGRHRADQPIPLLRTGRQAG